MPTHHITITHGDTSTGELTLSPPETVAETSNKIKWNIQSGCGVDSIVDIVDKKGFKNVWSTRPKHNNSWEGKIKSHHDIPNPYEYKYSIVWKKGSQTFTFDPKISINPALTQVDPAEEIDEKPLVALLISALFVTAVALMFWQNRKGKRNRRC